MKVFPIYLLPEIVTKLTCCIFSLFCTKTSSSPGPYKGNIGWFMETWMESLPQMRSIHRLGHTFIGIHSWKSTATR